MPWGVVAAGVFSAGAGMYDQSQASKSQQKAIAPLQNANAQMYSAAENIANTPYTAYTGQQVAPITANQEQAILAAGQNATNNEAGKDIAQSESLAGQIAANGWNTATAAKYMNPYTQNVTNVAQQQLNKQYATTIAGQNAAAASQGAFGGDRATLNNAATTGEYLTSSANTAAINQANAYNAAIQTWQADNNRMNTAAQSYQASGNDITQMNASQIKDLLATGGVEQATQQMKLNADYNDYLDQRGWAATELQPLISATSGKGTPAAPPSVNTASDLLGMGSALAGYFGSNTNSDPFAGTSLANTNSAMVAYNQNNAPTGSDISNLTAGAGTIAPIDTGSVIAPDMVDIAGGG
jgi:hypothetical protein